MEPGVQQIRSERYTNDRKQGRQWLENITSLINIYYRYTVFGTVISPQDTIIRKKIHRKAEMFSLTN